MTTDEKEHIRHCMLYEFDKGSSAVAAAKSIRAVYGDVIPTRTCQYWFKRFKGGVTKPDKSRSGRYSIVDTDFLKSVVESDPRLSTREIAVITGYSQSTIVRHLHLIGKTNRSGVWVPHELSDKNLLDRMAVCESMLVWLKSEPFLDRIVTGDEKWILYTNVVRKNQWLDRGQQAVSTPKPGLHPRKVMLCVWWDMFGVIHFELLNQGQTITSELYCAQLDRLSSALSVKRPQLLEKGVIFHHDNARPHCSRLTSQKISDLGWVPLEHPPYSPDLAPSDFHLFRSLQHFLAGRMFKTSEEIRLAISGFFNTKTASFYASGIEKLPGRWEAVFENGGQHIVD